MDRHRLAAVLLRCDLPESVSFVNHELSQVNGPIHQHTHKHKHDSMGLDTLSIKDALIVTHSTSTRQDAPPHLRQMTHLRYYPRNSHSPLRLNDICQDKPLPTFLLLILLIVLTIFIVVIISVFVLFFIFAVVFVVLVLALLSSL